MATTSSVDSAKTTASGGIGAKWVSLLPMLEADRLAGWKRSPNRSPSALDEAVRQGPRPDGAGRVHD